MNKDCLPHKLSHTPLGKPFGTFKVINISNKFFKKVLGEWTILKVEKWVYFFGRKGKTCQVVTFCSCVYIVSETSKYLLGKIIVKILHSNTRVCGPLIQLNVKLYSRVIKIIINIRNLKGEITWYNRDNNKLTRQSFSCQRGVCFIFLAPINNSGEDFPN